MRLAEVVLFAQDQSWASEPQAGPRAFTLSLFGTYYPQEEQTSAPARLLPREDLGRRQPRFTWARWGFLSPPPQAPWHPAASLGCPADTMST